MAAKLMTRTAAFMRVMKVPAKMYRPLFNAGRFLIRHPRLAAVATRGLMAVMKGRKIRRAVELPKYLKSETSVPDVAPEQVANPAEREGMALETPPDYEVGADQAAAAA
jgi:hypothetical protein